MGVPNFMMNANNVYRTKNYIVKQDISLERDCSGNSILFSTDTYYLRTKKLDKEFDLLGCHQSTKRIMQSACRTLPMTVNI